MKNNRHEIEDAEANAFAMALLMPEKFVRDEVRKMKYFDICNDKHIESLARKFKVPVSIMAMRIGQLLKP